MDLLVIRQTLDDLLPEAIDVDLMEAVRGLQHVQVLVHLVVLADELVAKSAYTLLSHLLHLLVDRMRSLFLMCTQEGIHVVSLDLGTLTVLTHVFPKIRAILIEHHLCKWHVSIVWFV